jgi:Fur family ferric uptake transcriptional regulator
MSYIQQKILKIYNLRVTECRLAIITIFIDAKHALTQFDIEQSLNSFDRVTVYRTLHSFEKNGLIHRVADTTGTVKYALSLHLINNEVKTFEENEANHLHFHCTKCGKTTCLKETLPLIILPQGMSIKSMNLVLDGLCSECKLID